MLVVRINHFYPSKNNTIKIQKAKASKKTKFLNFYSKASMLLNRNWDLAVLFFILKKKVATKQVNISFQVPTAK